MYRLSLFVGLTSCSAATPPVVLPGEMQKLAFYVGDWKCQGTTFAAADSPEDRWEATVHVRPEVGGAWLSVHMVGPGDNQTAELKGYDPEKQRWSHLWTSHTGAWGSTSSTGWEGDHMISYDDAQPTHRAVFTKLSDTRYSHRDEADEGAGFQGVWEKVCDKQ
jgi:hypothetical protein